MANLNETIGAQEGLVAGDHFDVERTVTGLDQARSVATAWMTVKHRGTDSDDDAIFQKEITDTDQPLVGHITETGAAGTEATMLFRLQPAETRKLEGKSRVYDIQIKLDDGTVTTPFAGEIEAAADVTKATS